MNPVATRRMRGNDREGSLMVRDRVFHLLYNEDMRIPTLPSSFRRLRWKLTLSYTGVTVAVMLALEVLVFGLGLFVARPGQREKELHAIVDDLAAGARPYLQMAPDAPESLEAWLARAAPADSLAVILNPEGEILASNLETLAAGESFVDEFAPNDSRWLIGKALMGKSDVVGLGDAIALIGSPIIDANDDLLGAVYVRIESFALMSSNVFSQSLVFLGVSLLILTAVAGVIGTFFGLFTARGFVRRLANLENATQAWGRGDFSATVYDPSPDEIGQLTRHMSLMARQIQELLKTRQELATSEERNRLARDLHDSVKQQAFATTLTLGSVQLLWDQDPEMARQQVAEALIISRQVQQELAGLIHELRPVVLEEKGLAVALEEYVQGWARHTGIESRVNVGGECAISQAVEHVFFRVTQEALANVAKHSEAERVEIMLDCTEETIILKVVDDGRGFDPAGVAGEGVGLSSMRERLAGLGGEVEVHSAPGEGTRIIARCDGSSG